MFKFFDLFSGIGGFHIAAARNGGECVFASEIDAEAQRVYATNFNVVPYGDITGLKEEDMPEHDMLCAGFPCQPFSIIGNRMGFDDMRGTLFFEIARILKAKKPKFFILENVRQLSTHNKSKTLRVILSCLSELGYKTHWKVMNALDYGLPQKRERVIIVGFLDKTIDFAFPDKARSRADLKDILEKNVDRKYFASERILEKRKKAHASKYDVAIWHENKNGNISSYPYSCALRAGASHNYLLVNGERRLTPREMLRLQGFPDTFKIICSYSQTKKQAGNAVPVPMVQSVIHKMITAKKQV